MKVKFKIILILSIIFVSFGNTGSEDEIIWDRNNKLSWDNFNGIPPKDSLNFDALTYYGYKYSLKTINNLLISFNSYLFFRKNKSWVRIKTPSLLNHEQGHFDIAEVYMRKFRKEVYTNMDKIKSISDCDKIFNESTFKLDSMQRIYDIQTDYSRNQGGQQKWNDSIKVWLDRYKEYADTVIYFSK
jgi:hypothetical protein